MIKCRTGKRKKMFERPEEPVITLGRLRVGGGLGPDVTGQPSPHVT
jgi:hypothetical protein